jgi:hypothetical protein
VFVLCWNTCVFEQKALLFDVSNIKNQPILKEAELFNGNTFGQFISDPGGDDFLNDFVGKIP